LVKIKYFFWSRFSLRLYRTNRRSIEKFQRTKEIGRYNRRINKRKSKRDLRTLL